MLKGTPRWDSTRSRSCPTAPVAPAMAMEGAAAPPFQALPDAAAVLRARRALVAAADIILKA